MVRISKQEERRQRSPHRHQNMVRTATGPKKDKLPKGYREHTNAVTGDLSGKVFIGKVKTPTAR